MARVHLFVRSNLDAVILLIGTLTILLPKGYAQQPFATDDADVAEYRRWHFETNAEYDFLPHSLYPNLRQFTQTVKFSYGLVRHCEVGMDFPLIISSIPAALDLGIHSA